MTATGEALVRHVGVEGYDFLDFGCSTGANIAHVNSSFPGLRGLGIDIDKNKVDKAKENGHDAIVYDILELPDEKITSFVTMAHFLEHLPGLGITRKIVAKAIAVSRDFILIRQPWFDSDGGLFREGLKFYWSDWLGHPNKMTTLDFYSMLKQEKDRDRIEQFSIYGRHNVASSKHPAIIPLNAPINQHAYDENLHGAKKIIKFGDGVFKEIVVRVDLRHSNMADALMVKLGDMPLIASY